MKLFKNETLLTIREMKATLKATPATFFKNHFKEIFLKFVYLNELPVVFHHEVQNEMEISTICLTHSRKRQFFHNPKVDCLSFCLLVSRFFQNDRKCFFSVGLSRGIGFGLKCQQLCLDLWQRGCHYRIITSERVNNSSSKNFIIF